MAVHYGYNRKGRLTGERQTVHHPETGELLWQHETKHTYNEQGLANRFQADSLPPVGVANVWQRLPGGNETGRHAAGGVHTGQTAPGNGAQLRQ